MLRLLRPRPPRRDLKSLNGHRDTRPRIAVFVGTGTWKGVEHGRGNHPGNPSDSVRGYRKALQPLLPSVPATEFQLSVLQDQLLAMQLQTEIAELTALARRTTAEHLLAVRELQDTLSRRSRSPPRPTWQPIGRTTPITTAYLHVRRVPPCPFIRRTIQGGSPRGGGARGTLSPGGGRA
jgi:hypothetical protein